MLGMVSFRPYRILLLHPNHSLKQMDWFLLYSTVLTKNSTFKKKIVPCFFPPLSHFEQQCFAFFSSFRIRFIFFCVNTASTPSKTARSFTLLPKMEAVAMQSKPLARIFFGFSQPRRGCVTNDDNGVTVTTKMWNSLRAQGEMNGLWEVDCYIFHIIAHIPL